MSPTSRRRQALRALTAATGLGLVATVTSVVTPAQAADPVTLTLLNINDFHGRIDENTTEFATTIEQIRAAKGDANTLFLSAGDNIGASLFASATQDDKPTLDVLDALDLAASAVGNHEFDRGFEDLSGRVQDEADFDYLGANVYLAGTQDPALDEYAIFDVAGVSVGVIGTVTEETPTLVSPAGIASLDFGDPVEAVNRVAAELSDGDEANGEADVIVAEFHEGTNEETIEEGIAAGGAFARIVTETAPEVDVLFTGHTHQEYVFEAAVPGGEGTRPVVQTGSYGANVGQVDLTVQDGEVIAHAAQNVARAEAEDLTLPRVAEVKTIVDAALAHAAEVGNQPVGEITDDITTAFTDGSYVDGEWVATTRDDRSSESTLGHLVANALRDGVSGFAQPDLGLTNPGGLRAELLYAGDTSTNPENTDGVVTYAEANAVLPFNNTVALVELTGAQLKQVIEEQWQRNSDEPPSREYLQLGFSDNVQVTVDPDAPLDQHVTSVRIDGELLDPAATYLVSTLSFLAQGGDNFHTFAEADYVDTGLLDAELWREYLATNSPIKPDHTQLQVFSTLPAKVRLGSTVSFELPELGLTSLGSPEDSTVTASLDEEEIATFDVVDRTAAITMKVPGSADAGSVLTFTSEQGVTVSTRIAKAESDLRVRVRPRRIFADRTDVRLRVRVRAEVSTRGDVVEVRRRGDVIGTAELGRAGRARINLGDFDRPGVKRVRVVYLGSDEVKRDREVVRIRVHARR